MNWDRKMTHWFQLPQRQVVYRLEDLARSKGQVSVELSRSDFSPNSGTGWRFFGNHQTMGISAKMGISPSKIGNSSTSFLDVLQDMWHSCPKVFAIVVSVLPAVSPLPKTLHER